jgi:sec-independent protein translocase protein TatA
MMPGPFELIIILVIVLLIFGGKRLKNIGGDLGNAIKGFKKSMKDEPADQIDTKDDIVEAKIIKEETKQEK